MNVAVATLNVSGCAEHVLFLCSSLCPAFQQPGMAPRGTGEFTFVSVPSVVQQERGKLPQKVSSLGIP